ncbi:MAG: hypothetical protein K8T90_22430 [Planctomycetes bacterium]|nr:hypothetical protein [Planctomycetota bacterium]
MDPARIAVLAALLPAAVAAAVLFLLRWRARGSVPPGAAPAASGGVTPPPGVPTWLAVTAAYAAGHLALNGLPRGLPKEAWQTLLPLAVVTGATLALDRLLRGRIRTRPWFCGTTFVLVFAASLRFAREPGWAVTLGAAFVAACTIFDASAARAANDGPRPMREPTRLAGHALVAVATAGALVIAGTLVVGQLAGVLAAALGAVFLLSLRMDVNSDGAANAACVLLPALWLNGVLFAELPWWSVVCFALATIVLRVRRRELRTRAEIVIVGIAALLSAAAVWIAKASVPPLDY